MLRAREYKRSSCNIDVTKCEISSGELSVSVRYVQQLGQRNVGTKKGV